MLITTLIVSSRRFYSIKNINLIKEKVNLRNKMSASIDIDLSPPSIVRGMTCLEREKFKKMVEIPKLSIPEEKLNKVLYLIKKYLLKMDNLKPIVQNPEKENEKYVYLNPLSVKGWNYLPMNDLTKYGVTKENFLFGELELNYENFKPDDILKAILPENQEGCSSFSIIGHIVHINLREHLETYKQIIGEILMDKVSGCKTVVNKSQIIDNTYRNFELELICGEKNFQAVTKENGATFEFDFSKVYWNPRLATEHDRVIKPLKADDILYDVFAGVGPFSIPAAKKKCTVLANDLNPESFKWLNHNIEKNKCQEYIKTFEKDGRYFILEDIRNHLIDLITSGENKTSKIHITMNLPAMAVEFLNSFHGLLPKDLEKDFDNIQKPLVHLYCFIKGDRRLTAIKNFVETNAGYKILDEGIYFVRNVAPNKDMYRVAFYLTKEVLCNSNYKRTADSDGEQDDISAKKMCLNFKFS